jgi:hypothetical protein
MQTVLATEDERGHGQALAQLESIKELVAALVAAEEAEDDDAREAAEQRIHEDPLSVEVRTGWMNMQEYNQIGSRLGAQPPLGEYRILLCTGGPAARLIGELGEYGEPASAQLEYQDWFTPWQALRISDGDRETLIRYARCFYFGE